MKDSSLIALSVDFGSVCVYVHVKSLLGTGGKRARRTLVVKTTSNSANVAPFAVIV